MSISITSDTLRLITRGGTSIMIGWSFIVNDTNYSSMNNTVKIIPFGEILVGMRYWEISCLRGLIIDYPNHKERCTVMNLFEAMGWVNAKIDSFFDGWEAALLQSFFYTFMKSFSDTIRKERYMENDLHEYQREYLDSVGIDPFSENIFLITIEQIYNWSFFELSLEVEAARRAAKLFLDSDDTILKLYDFKSIDGFQEFSLQIAIIEGKFVQIITAGNLISALLFDMTTVLERETAINMCPNCGKYFIPPNRSDTKYCSRKSPQDESKTCQEYGAYSAWIKKSKEDETYSLYRKIYMQKQMMAKRNPEIPAYRENFEQFKKDSNNWKNQVKIGSSTPDAYLDWLKQQT